MPTASVCPITLVMRAALPLDLLQQDVEVGLPGRAERRGVEREQQVGGDLDARRTVPDGGEDDRRVREPGHLGGARVVGLGRAPRTRRPRRRRARRTDPASSSPPRSARRWSAAGSPPGRPTPNRRRLTPRSAARLACSGQEASTAGRALALADHLAQVQAAGVGQAVGDQHDVVPGGRGALELLSGGGQRGHLIGAGQSAARCWRPRPPWWSGTGRPPAPRPGSPGCRRSPAGAPRR